VQVKRAAAIKRVIRSPGSATKDAGGSDCFVPAASACATLEQRRRHRTGVRGGQFAHTARI